MTSRARASPRAAQSWHLELAQSPLMPLPTFSPWEGWQWVSCPASFSSVQLLEVSVDLLNSTPGSPNFHSLWFHKLYSRSFPEPSHSFILTSRECFTELLLCTRHPWVPPWDTSVKKTDKDSLLSWRLHSSPWRQTRNSRNNQKILECVRRW